MPDSKDLTSETRDYQTKILNLNIVEQSEYC